MVVLVNNDKTMVIEDGGYIQLEVKKQVPTTKKDVVHYDMISKIRKELHEEAELEQLGIPTEEEMEQFLVNNIPIPSKLKYESMNDSQIESLVPSVAEIMETMLKGKTTSEQKKPNLDADGLPTIEQIRAELGIKEVV